ncbi:MAG TPA: 6-phosphogluconolactonase [Candidatus Eisenbacteria bacterium]
MAPGRLRVVPDTPALAEAAAGEFLSIGAEAIRSAGRFTVALAGGNTPRLAYERIAATWRDAPDGPLDWSRVQLFWGDERYVPRDDPQSNYRMAREALIVRVPVPADNIHPAPTDLPDPREAAARYEATIRGIFRLVTGGVPRFDLVLLGMGADGHTASLFPGTEALDATERLTAAVHVSALDSWRITLTLPVLNRAANVIFLVSGADKAPTLRAVVEGPAAAPPLPAQRVLPESGSLTWIADRDAAPWAG